MAGTTPEQHQSSRNEKSLWIEMPPMGKRLPLINRKPLMQCHMPGRGRCHGERLAHGMDHFVMGMEQVALMQAVVEL